VIDAANYVFESFEDGGVLVDLPSGLFFRLNQTAAEIWRQALGGETPETIARILGHRFSLPPEAVRDDVVAALKLPSGETSARPAAEHSLQFSPLGFVVHLGEKPTLDIDEHEKRIRVRPSVTGQDLGDCLRTIVPRLLSRADSPVLHAAAVKAPDDTIWALLGSNGAGKTTTARSFGTANGFALVCEDKLMTRRTENSLGGVLEGEIRLNQWIREAKRRLQLNPGDGVPMPDPGVWDQCPSLPIERIFLIDSNRRQGSSIHLRQLSPSDAVPEIMRHVFFRPTQELNLPQHLSGLFLLARSIPVYVATLPGGLSDLDKAVHAYIATVTS
jgi:hypothetical protein